MGRRLAYPDVSHATIYEIYKQCLCKPIHACGTFVNRIALYNRLRGYPDSPDIPIEEDQGQFLSDVEEKLLSVGVDELSIADVPTPKQYRTHPLVAEEGWLIILGTGFDKTPHVPIPNELTQRVREVLQTEEPAAWWSMRKFSYPHPKGVHIGLQLGAEFNEL